MEAMCRVLVVEDEYLMQQGIKYLVDWEREGFEIIGSASNGKEALELVESLRPHIVLTDVVMPVMNGVELTAALREDYPEIQVVVISGYSDFEYVRATFQGGAVDYILKPTLSPQSLLETMRGAAARIPGLILGQGKGSPEIWLGRLLAGFLQEGSAPLREVFPESCFILVGEHTGRVFGGDKAASGNQSAALKRGAQKYLSGFPYLQTVTEEGILLLVVNFPPERQSSALHAAAQTIEAAAAGEPRTFFICSPAFHGLEKLRETYYGPFLRCTEQPFYYQGVHFLRQPEDAPDQAQRLDTGRFSQLLEDARFDEALALLCDYVDAAALAHEPEEPELKNLVQNAFYQVIVRLEDLGLEAGSLAHLKRACLTRLQSCPWMESFAQAMVEILADLNNILEAYSIGRKSGAMEEILAYIDTHYADPITLRSLAQEFNFSYSYLSSFFHSHHQEGFNDYLNKVRIHEACRLLQAGEPVAVVCGEVGYGDQSYFTKVFKKYTGRTPGEYRRGPGREGKL